MMKRSHHEERITAIPDYQGPREELSTFLGHMGVTYSILATLALD